MGLSKPKKKKEALKGKTYSFGEVRKKQVWDFIAALYKQAMVERQFDFPPDVEIQRYNWLPPQQPIPPKKADRPRLEVRITLSAMRDLLQKSIDPPTVRMIHNYYLPQFLGMLNDLRTRKQGRGAEKWHFELTLWATDLERNRRIFEKVWKNRYAKSLGNTENDAESSTDSGNSGNKNQNLGSSGQNKTPGLSLSMSSTPPAASECVLPERFAFPLYVNPRYVPRPALEDQCLRILAQLGAVLRLQAPQQMGKTIFVQHLLHQLSSQCKGDIAFVSLKLADRLNMENLDEFLRWLCAHLSQQMQLPVAFDQHWPAALFGSKVSCTYYLGGYLLIPCKKPLIICFDDLDLLLPYPTIRQDFFSLIRAWHEQMLSQPSWSLLKLILVQSTEPCARFEIEGSSYSLGSIVELPPFNAEEVKNLAERREWVWQDSDIDAVMQLLGGHPHLVSLAIAHLKAYPEISLDRMIEEAPTETGIYDSHLRERLTILRQQPALIQAFQELLAAESALAVDTLIAHALHNLGLVRRVEGKFEVSCELYRRYFRDRL